jgi:hypothetical protein
VKSKKNTSKIDENKRIIYKQQEMIDVIRKELNDIKIGKVKLPITVKETTPINFKFKNESPDIKEELYKKAKLELTERNRRAVLEMEKYERDKIYSKRESEIETNVKMVRDKNVNLSNKKKANVAENIINLKENMTCDVVKRICKEDHHS